ncbi:hypothetical protein SAMN02745165_02939 [Malonomonas rubra DSM 5091]|uniref:Hook-length control protein FliK n=1 Tax=Malonomonas rubra DSM 5091 TaxID=1122189 RepID=A0A1M6LAR1_MALRU|nr:hypothetical protein [Malonomonas rubra]SHJ68254.1 hypothetical protein SAMN02745165_02939 [Malonomonas rubra DSM 5091]
MSIVNPLATPNQVTPQQAAVPVESAEQRQIDLRPEQMVRATVVEGGLDRALLEMNHQQYRAKSDIELQAGQKLMLQVLQTQPTLEFRIVNDPLLSRLGQLLPLLSQNYDWAKLLESIQQPQQQQNLPPTAKEVHQQLLQLLQPNGQAPVGLDTNLAKLPRQLQQLFQAVANNPDKIVLPQQGQAQAPQGALLQAQPVPVGEASAAAQTQIAQLAKDLQVQLSQLQQAGNKPMAESWLAETRNILQPLHQQNAAQLHLQAKPQMDNLFALLGQMRQQPNLPPQLSGELERLVLQLKQPDASLLNPEQKSQPQQVAGQAQDASAARPQQAVAAPQVTAESIRQAIQASGVYRPPAGAAQATQPNTVTAPVVPAEISAGLEKLLAQVQQAQADGGKLPPELLGRLEGLLDKLQRLPQVQGLTQPLLPGLENINQQLVQLIQQGPQQPNGGALGVLSQLFGFHLEAELLKGKTKEALANLKASLLAMQKELGEEVKEPLKRLELFQLCKARLAEEQVQFIPLPFNELEEGYLLMEQGQQDDEDDAVEPPLHITLSLRVSALGNMRVDMLYDQHGLHLRMACESKEKMAYLQEHASELEESIETVSLNALSFSDDARVPSRELLEKLLPDALGMLNTRI